MLSKAQTEGKTKKENSFFASLLVSMLAVGQQNMSRPIKEKHKHYFVAVLYNYDIPQYYCIIPNIFNYSMDNNNTVRTH